MAEKLSDYDSLGLIIPDSVGERDRILSFITKEENKIGNGYHERYADPKTLGYAELNILETNDLFILFRSQNSGVFKPSKITDSYKNDSKYADLITLQEALEKENFHFRLLEATSYWEDRHELWTLTTLDNNVITIDINEIKPKSPAGYLKEVMEYYYEDNVLPELDYTQEQIEQMSLDEKVAAVLDNDAFCDSTGYYEWEEEEITLAIQRILKEEAKKAK